MPVKLRIALQKSGRLSESSLQLLRECGIDFNGSGSAARLKFTSHNFPVEALFLRDDDIAEYVADGVVDAGILGLNTLAEKRDETSQAVRQIENLGFARCRLAIAVPREMKYSGLKDLSGKKVATSHPRVLRRFFEEHQIQAAIHEISGSVEIAPGIGLADAICDLVSSGSTLSSNGLRECETVIDSQAVLIARASLESGVEEILQKFLFRIRAVRSAKKSKYVLLNAPNDALDKIIDVLPGMKSPTIVPLALEGWSSVHSVMEEDEFWQKIENLREAGAQGILIIPIEKMIL